MRRSAEAIGDSELQAGRSSFPAADADARTRVSHKTYNKAPILRSGPSLWLGPGSNRRPIAFQAIARTN